MKEKRQLPRRSGGGYNLHISKGKEELLSSFFYPNSQEGGYKYLVASSEVML